MFGFVQIQNAQFDEKTAQALQSQNELLIKQNEDLMELEKVLGGKLAGGHVISKAVSGLAEQIEPLKKGNN